MLSKPNVKEIMPKVGNRYQAALAISKRARNIEDRRVAENDRNIHDAVDLAAEEIVNGKAYVKIDGEYVIEPEIKEVEENNLEELEIQEDEESVEDEE